MNHHLEKNCEGVDASVFSGDVLYDDESRAELKNYIGRWTRAIAEYEGAAAQAAQPEAVGLTSQQRVMLAQAWTMLEDYAVMNRRVGNDSFADGAIASAHEIKLLLASALPEPMSAPTAEPVAWEYCEEVFWHSSPELNDHIRQNGRALVYATPPSAATPEPATDKLADRALAKSFRENPREASLADQAGMRRAINDPLTNRAFNMDGCATPEPNDAEREAIRQELLNTPEVRDFATGVVMEALHQRERWGSEHDAGKTPADWFWLVGYLAGKALHAQIAGNTNKALHHTISTAAALANWHAAITGTHTAMRPGIDNAAIRATKGGK